MDNEDSKIVTFYSYKGGVGRSMALANVAWLLAGEFHKKVLVVDWDLEAPGLHKFFNMNNEKIENGLIDLFYSYKDIVRQEIHSIEDEFMDIDKYIIPISNDFIDGSISILPAGRNDEKYATQVNNFDWNEFYKNWHGFGFIEYLKVQLKNKFDFVLIDSRTGVTDIGGICTLQMPDLVVLLFSPNEQNISGTESIINNILKSSTKHISNTNKIDFIPIPSRVEKYLEKEILEEWELKIAKRFGKYFPKNEDPIIFIKQKSIPYIGYYSFGEKLAVDDDIYGPLAYSYIELTKIILNKVDILVDKHFPTRSSMIFGKTDDGLKRYTINRADPQFKEYFSKMLTTMFGDVKLQILGYISILSGLFVMLISLKTSFFEFSSGSFPIIISLILLGLFLISTNSYQFGTKCETCNQYFVLEEIEDPLIEELDVHDGVRQTITRTYKCRNCGSIDIKKKKKFIEDRRMGL